MPRLHLLLFFEPRMAALLPDGSLSLSLDICFLYMVLYVTLLPLDGLLYLIDEYVIWVYAVKSAERMCRWHSSACTAAPSMLRSN